MTLSQRHFDRVERGENAAVSAAFQAHWYQALAQRLNRYIYSHSPSRTTTPLYFLILQRHLI